MEDCGALSHCFTHKMRDYATRLTTKIFTLKFPYLAQVLPFWSQIGRIVPEEIALSPSHYLSGIRALIEVAKVSGKTHI